MQWAAAKPFLKRIQCLVPRGKTEASACMPSSEDFSRRNWSLTEPRQSSGQGQGSCHRLPPSACKPRSVWFSKSSPGCGRKPQEPQGSSHGLSQSGALSSMILKITHQLAFSSKSAFCPRLWLTFLWGRMASPSLQGSSSCTETSP